MSKRLGDCRCLQKYLAGGLAFLRGNNHGVKMQVSAAAVSALRNPPRLQPSAPQSSSVLEGSSGARTRRDAHSTTVITLLCCTIMLMRTSSTYCAYASSCVHVHMLVGPQSEMTEQDGLIVPTERSAIPRCVIVIHTVVSLALKLCPNLKKVAQCPVGNCLYAHSKLEVDERMATDQCVICSS